MQRFLADGYALIIAVEGERLQVVPRNAWFESLEDYEIDEAAIDQIYVRAYGDVAVAEQCEIRLGRHLGRQITYESAGGAKRKSYSRWFLVGNRLYDVTWIAGYRQPAIAAVQECLDSFHLLAEPQSEVASVI